MTITGPGVIDGNKVFDPHGEEHMRGPHAVLFGDSQNVLIRDVHVRDAANYAILLQRTSHIEIRGVECSGGWDGVQFRGRKDQPCRDVRVIDCSFFTGDDCIAGGYSEDALIDRCVINSSCNGIRLIGSGTEAHHPRLPVLRTGPVRAPHVTPEASHQHAGRPLSSAGALDGDRRCC